MKNFFKTRKALKILWIILFLVAVVLLILGFRSCNNLAKPKAKVVQIDEKQKQIDSLRAVLIISQEQLVECQKNCIEKVPEKIVEKPIRKKAKKVITSKEKKPIQVPPAVVEIPKNVEFKLPKSGELEEINVTVEKPKKAVTKIVPKKIETKKVETEDDCPTCPRRYGTIEFHY